MLTRVTLAAFLALYAISAWPQADPALAAKLRQGGYVLFLRHTSTDFSRDEARKLSAQIERLRIPIGPVHASPFCRTQETARLAFGRAERASEARGGPALFGSPYLAEGEMAVVDPSAFVVAGRIRLDDWQALD
ncbi:MAG TPA: hypothetical protein VE085_13580 [Burkholderiales bacterium]|nr:hypothetical protein [Burkholderiales bacterium]